MDFEFATAGRIIFGCGARHKTAGIAQEFGRTVLIFTGSTPKRSGWLIDEIHQLGLNVITVKVEAEPSTHLVEKYTRLARAESVEVIIAVGGGSVIDTAKAVSALATNTGDIFYYLEVIGDGNSLTKKPLPLIALPTTAGTGSEVTRNAVLASPEHHVKVSLRHRWMIPAVAIIDPELTLSLPPEITASSGLDALTQLIEGFTTKSPNPIVDSICREGISYIARSLKQAFQDSGNLKAREDMCLASMFSGLALANAGLGAVHGFAGPIGGLFDAPHGMICARLLPFVTAANIHILKQRSPESPSLQRYRNVAQLLTGITDGSDDCIIDWLNNLYKILPIKPLRNYGISENDIPFIIEKSKISSSMKGNPIELTDRDMNAILNDAL